MKRKMPIILLVVICMLISTTAFASEKTVTNDFDESTNQVCFIGELTFEVPSSWVPSDNNTDDRMSFYCTNGTFMVQRLDYEGDVLEEENRADYLQSIQNGVENLTDFTSETLHLDGCDKDVLFFECFCTISDTDVDYYGATGSFEDNTQLIVFAFCDYTNSDLDHENDYYSILDSISYNEQNDSDYEAMYYDLLEKYEQLQADYDALYNNMEKEAPVESAEVNEAESAAPSENIDSGDLTLGQQNALKSAESYLSFSAFSYTGLIDQLEFEGYSTEEATFAADNCGADWNEQAVKSAESYLSFSSFSRDGLISQLEYEGFTTAQAEYAVNAVGY